MDSVIITGADAEPAHSIARRLCGMGIRVYALAGKIPEIGLPEDEFVPVPCDLTSPDAVASAVGKILAETPQISGVILAGQYLSEERFECVSPEEIALALNAQVASPLTVARLALPSLIAARGNVVVVSPGAGTAAGRALNAAADAALRSFAGTLFAELRDTGVKTCHILLQNNEGAADPAAKFTTAPQSRIHADIVADAVETVFRLRENNALTQMILRPQATRETPHIPVSAEPKIRALQSVQLPPPKNFPPEEEPIRTPAYRRPDYAPAKNARQDAERDDDGFADDYVDPELRYLVKNGGNAAPSANPQNGGNAQNENSGNPNREGRGKRRRRRGKHGRENRNPAEGAIRVNAPQFGGGQPRMQPPHNLPEQRQEKKPEEKPFPPEKQEPPSVPATENSSPVPAAENAGTDKTVFAPNPDVPAAAQPAAAAAPEEKKSAPKRSRKPRETSSAEKKEARPRKRKSAPKKPMQENFDAELEKNG